MARMLLREVELVPWCWNEGLREGGGLSVKHFVLSNGLDTCSISYKNMPLPLFNFNNQQWLNVEL